MQVIRPVQEGDLPALVALARATGGGLTTQPLNQEFLADRIAESLRAFSPRVKQPGGEFYRLVLEDTDTGEITGVSGIGARIGAFHSWYATRSATSLMPISRSASRSRFLCCT